MASAGWVVWPLLELTCAFLLLGEQRLHVWVGPCQSFLLYLRSRESPHGRGRNTLSVPPELAHWE